MMQQTTHKTLIGIDCGVETGIAFYSIPSKTLTIVRTVKIHEAMTMVKRQFAVEGKALLVRFEDARLRTWFGNAGREQLQGAGSIKRDAKIWEDFLTDLGIEFEMVPPKNNMTKIDSGFFKRLTGWNKQTNEHGRDAAMLVFGR